MKSKTGFCGPGNIRIEKIYLDREAEGLPLARKIMRGLKGVPVERVSDRGRFLEMAGGMSLAAGKRTLWISCFKGPFVKPCPGTHADYFCCGYRIINVQTHCPLDCTYCILQNYLNRPFLTVYANTAQIPAEIDALIKKHPKRLFRIGTGELTDSLALDPLIQYNRELIAYAGRKKFILELKTKTASVGHLPRVRSKNIVVSWSLNPPDAIRREEHKAAPLAARLEAAALAVRKGYRLGFHFDPVLEIPDWERQYAELIRGLTETVSENDVYWISMGSLRFPPDLKKVMDQRFPHSGITAGEFVSGRDGKMRYFRPVRVRMYQRLYEALRAKWKNVFVYFCMENEPVWKAIMGFSPGSNAGLDFLFHENLYRRFPELKLANPDRAAYQGERKTGKDDGP